MGSNDDITLRKYLDEVGKIPLLSEEEELELGKRIKDQHDISAINELVVHNLLLVASIALHYTARDIPSIDLIEEGNFGLFLAAQRFDYTKGVKFSTYATICINQRIGRALPNYNHIRTPFHIDEAFRKITAVSDLLAKKYQRNITDEDVANFLEMDESKVRNIKNAYRDVVSLDIPVGEDDDATLNDIVKDNNMQNVDDEALDNIFRKELFDALDVLNEREKEVILYRYPLNGGRKLKLKEIAKIYGITSTRVGQIEENALNKLKKNNKLRQLTKEYYSEVSA